MGIVNYPCAVLNIRGNEPIVTNYECYSLHTSHRHLNLLNINFPLYLVARQYHYFFLYFPSYSFLHFLFSFMKPPKPELNHSYWVMYRNTLIYCRKNLFKLHLFFRTSLILLVANVWCLKRGVADRHLYEDKQDSNSDSTGVDSVLWISQTYITLFLKGKEHIAEWSYFLSKERK